MIVIADQLRRLSQGMIMSKVQARLHSVILYGSTSAVWLEIKLDQKPLFVNLYMLPKGDEKMLR